MTKTKDIRKSMSWGSLLVIGEDFMEIMGEYQDRQHHDPDFDVNAGLYDLYVDLSKLYNHYKDE